MDDVVINTACRGSRKKIDGFIIKALLGMT